VGLEDARTYLRRSGAVVEQLHAELILLASSGAGADLGASGRDAEAEAKPPAMVEERARPENQEVGPGEVIVATRMWCGVRQKNEESLPRPPPPREVRGAGVLDTPRVAQRYRVYVLVDHVRTQ
jgi:hypothetical protein